MSNQIGLYAHIPFCVSKCVYCDFYSLTDVDKRGLDDYLKVMQAHLRETAEFTGKKAKGGVGIDTVYFGGGTPTLFGADRIKALLKAIQTLWAVSRNAEITVEANPESVDEKQLRKLHRAGVNRISFGVQAMQDEHLKALGRAHDAARAKEAVAQARAAGFDNVSVDLLFGLPEQTAEQLYESLEWAVGAKVEHISVYGLKVEERTPLYKARDKFVFPDDDAQAAMYLATVAYLEREGYEQYEISNFARPGWACRHNLKYWQLDPYIGIGPSAHSDFGGKRYSNVRSLEVYCDGVRNGDSVIDEMTAVPLLERAGEYVMCGLRTAYGISGNAYTKQYKVSFDPIERRLERFMQYDLTQRHGDRWRLTPKGFLVSNSILAELLSAESQDVSGNMAAHIG